VFGTKESRTHERNIIVAAIFFARAMGIFIHIFPFRQGQPAHSALRPNRPIKSRRACRITPLSRNIQEKLVFVYPARGDRRARGESVFFFACFLDRCRRRLEAINFGSARPMMDLRC